MPSFFTMAFKTLLEPTTTITTADKPTSADDSNSGDALRNKPPRPPSHLYIKSPALYTTPESKPIPAGVSAQPDSPSPYVLIRKRPDFPSSDPEGSVNGHVDGYSSSHQNVRSDVAGGEDDGKVEACSDGDGLFLKLKEKKKEGDDGDGDFLEAFETRSVASSTDVDGFAKQSLMSPRSVVFFDADEEFFSDGSLSNMSSSHISNIESELHSTRLALLEETEKRKAAEDAVDRMCSQWLRIGKKLNELGLTLPTPSTASNNVNSELEIDPIEQLLQELVVTRFVSEAISIDLARAEAEIAAAAIVKSKDQEISRLRDRLQYYETVNQEMSQRNLEAVETARRQRKRRRQRRWLLGCIGLSAAIGASVIVCSYFPRTNTNLSASTSDSDAAATNSSA